VNSLLGIYSMHPLVSKWIYRAQLSSRTSNALNALVSSEQILFVQTSETVCTEGGVPDKIRERVSGCGAGNWEGPTAVSVGPSRRGLLCQIYLLHLTLAWLTTLMLLIMPRCQQWSQFIEDTIEPSFSSPGLSSCSWWAKN